MAGARITEIPVHLALYCTVHLGQICDKSCDKCDKVVTASQAASNPIVGLIKWAALWRPNLLQGVCCKSKDIY